jgi:peroxiredoxin
MQTVYFMITKMRNILIAIIALGMTACAKAPEQKGFVVKGKIRNLTGNQITLQELTTKGLVFIDSAAVGNDGSFEFNGNVGQKTFCVIQANNSAIVLVVDSVTDMVLNIDAGKPEDFTVTGSNDTEKLKKLLQLNNAYMLGVQALETKYAAYNNNVPPMNIQEQIRKEYDSIMTARTVALQAHVLELENTLVPYFATNYLMPQSDFIFLKQVDAKYFAQFAGSKYAQDLHKRIEVLNKTAIGSVAPDIVLADPFGKTVSLSSLRGKTVLVDFWASWCGPCRRESPNLVKAYNKYKTRGFEIFSVSLDDNRDAWQRAINDDKLLWTHVSDLQKWNSSVVNQYNIESIPFTVLIDAEGKIIAKNLRGDALDARLAELLK